MKTCDTRRATPTDRLWLGLCAISLLCYLHRSEAVRAFAGEVSRLLGKF